MDKLFTYLKFSGFLLLLPTLMVLLTLLAGIFNIGMGSQQFGIMTLVLPSVVFATIFYKHVKLMRLIHSISARTFIMAFVFAVLLFITISFIEDLNKDLSSFSKKDFSLSFLLLMLIFTPIMEEICCRIIIINRFYNKIPFGVLIISTSLLFAMLHIRDIYLFSGTFFMGLVLGYLYVIFQNGALLILIHFFYNLIYFLESSVFYSFTQKVIMPYYFKTWHYIIVAVSLTLLLLILFRKSRELHIPEQSGRPFRFNADSYSVLMRTVIPF